MPSRTPTAISRGKDAEGPATINPVLEKLKEENSKLKTVYRDLHSRAVGRIKAVRETNQKLAKAHDSLRLKFDRSHQIATRLQGQVQQLEQQV